MRLFFLAFLLLASVSAQSAELFKGHIKKLNDVVILVSQSQIEYTLSFNNDVSNQQIQRLNNGDFASVTADVDPTNSNLIHVSSVDYIGLEMLMGVWRSDVNMCYEFTSFTRLYAYTPDKYNECVRKNDSDAEAKYTYFINPDIDVWNMLISSNTSEFVGKLNILNLSNVEITLFDSRTDAILGTIVLRR